MVRVWIFGNKLGSGKSHVAWRVFCVGGNDTYISKSIGRELNLLFRKLFGILQCFTVIIRHNAYSIDFYGMHTEWEYTLKNSGIVLFK